MMKQNIQRCDKCNEELLFDGDIYYVSWMCQATFSACKKCYHEISDEINAFICEYFIPTERRKREDSRIFMSCGKEK